MSILFNNNYTVKYVGGGGAAKLDFFDYFYEEDIRVVDYGDGRTLVIVFPEMESLEEEGTIVYDGLTTDKMGILTVTVDNYNYVSYCEENDYIYFVDVNQPRSPGTYPIDITYSGDKVFNSFTINNIAEIYSCKTIPAMSCPDVTSYIDESAIINVYLPSDATGTVTIEIDGGSHSVNVVNGVATYTASNLSTGSKTVLIDYEGDSNYSSNHITSTLNIIKYEVHLTLRTL